MRISERHRYDITSNRIENAKAANEQMMEQISTQKRITNISDDPIGLSRAIKGHSQISDFKQLNKNLDFSQGFLERTEAAVSGIHDRLIRAKELSIAMANSTYGAGSREATSRELKELMEEIVSLSNTQYANRFVFSGFRTDTPSMTLDGQYCGDDGAIFLQVDGQSFHQINLQARNLFEASPEERAAGHFNLYDSLDNLYQGMAKNEVPAILKSLEELDFQMEKMSSYQATIGARTKGLEEAKARIGLQTDMQQEAVSKIEETDIFKATSDFKRTETILQSTLMASNKLLQPSLLNFMQ